jgi:hypothetical protein
MLVTIDNRGVGIHALIVGVSDYTNLPGDDDPAAGGNKLGMKKLKAPTLGAYRFLKWLIKADEENRLLQPLASYEVVLAPSPEERAEPGLEDWIDDATTGSFVKKTIAWRKRVGKSKKNVALFYFSGHGIQRNKDDAILMLQDFAEDEVPMLKRAVALYEIFGGMAPSDEFPEMGMTQLYFIDACRNLPERIKSFAKLQPETVFDVQLGGRDDRVAPIFFAAVNDSVAFGEAGKGSYFNRALLVGLERGAENTKEVDGRTVWPVSVFTLVTAITHEFAKFETDQNFVQGGLFRDCDICYLNQAPLVDLTIEVLPDAQRESAVIIMTQMVNPPLVPFEWKQPDPPPDYPYTLTSPAGIHRIFATQKGVAAAPMSDKGFQVITQRNRLLRVRL